MEEVRLLTKRAEEFLELAKLSLEKGYTDLAAFHVEQAVQLRLKAALLRLVSDYPRVHSIRYLLSLIIRVVEELGFHSLAEELQRFAREKRELLIALEDAYTSARYGGQVYSESEVEALLKLAIEVFKIVKRVEDTVLG